MSTSVRTPLQGLAGALLIAVAAILLGQGSAGLTIVRGMAGSTPVSLTRPAGAADPGRPVVVIAHGFAGSRQMMQSLAASLAQNGYAAVTFDFPGHGRNRVPMAGGLDEEEGAVRGMLSALADAVGYGRSLAGAEAPLALVGHSMGADLVIRHAATHPEIAATVAISSFFREVTPDSPRNLLVVTGALEPGPLHEGAVRAVEMTAGGPVEEGTTYGRFGEGTARRLVSADGVEHIGVLFSPESHAETVAWLNAAFGRDAPVRRIDSRGPWLVLLILGLVLLGRPITAMLPRIADPPVGAGLGWRRLLPVAAAPAVLTPLLLWPAPTDLLPILVGDYLALHFLVYGLLTAIGLALAGHPLPLRRQAGVRGDFLFGAAAGMALYGTAALALVLDGTLLSYFPTPDRALLIPLILIGTLAWAWTDEWLTRGVGRRPGAYAVTKLCFLISLGLAVALDPPRQFFLLIFAPVIVAYFAIYGVLSGEAYRVTGHPLVGAAMAAFAFAWAIAVTLPMVN